MKRLKIYYIGLILAIVSMNWLTHFAVEPSINFNNVYTQRALIETGIQLISVLLLLLFSYYNNSITKGLLILSLTAAAVLFVVLLVELIKAEATLFNMPYYLVYAYCLFFCVRTIYQSIFVTQPR